MFVPGFEDRSPKWTSTVSTIMRRCGDLDELAVGKCVKVDTENGEIT